MESAFRDTTILFTDIEGSTRLWEEDPARMSHALASHDAIARAAVERNRGVVVKTTGDGLYAAFADAVDGVNASLMLQQGLSDPAVTNGIALRVRCGLHRGAVERRDDDYFGPPVNRTARLMGAAHGGQILLSQSVVDSVRTRLPAEVELRDLGGIRLKDLTAPERVFQIVHPRLRKNFPALRSLESTPNNLPQQLTSFVGRERELDEARTLLHGSRLMTLLGMGGLGKTRMALQLAADALDAYPDGVWFLDLAPIRDSSLVPSVAAQALGVQEEPQKSLKQTLCEHVRARRLLLIFDNCEHLVAACAALAHALLQSGPDVQIVATTREALRVSGEQTYHVMPLAVPDSTAGVDVLARSDAVQLFVDRSRLHRPSFSLSEAEGRAVAELCARLEGIPLALELAAARMRTLSVAEINVRLRDRFKLLTGGGRVLLERQQTLRALVDWSYDLLEDNERVLFDRLCVFAGGFDTEACERICGIEPLSSEDVFDLLTSLVDKSLVMAETSRFRTLETIRYYAREKLVQREEIPLMATRHCDYFLNIAKAGRAGIAGPEQAEWTQRLEAELDNLRAAIKRALDGRVAHVLAVKFEVALMPFWMLRGYTSEGRNYVRASLALPQVCASVVAHGHALYVGACLANNQSDYPEAVALLERCLALRREIGNEVDIAATLSTLSLVRLQIGDATKAREGEEEALSIFRKLGDRIGEAIGLIHLGQIYMHVGDDARAIEYFEQCLAIAVELKHCEAQSECERMLGEIALDKGDVAAARAWFVRSLKACKGAGDKRDEATSLWWLGKADAAAGDVGLARTRIAEALTAFQAFEMNAEIVGCVEDLAGLAGDVGAREAASLFAAADAHRERLALARPPRGSQRWENATSATRATLGQETFDAAWSEGRKWPLERAIGGALALAG
ncbi:MAG TPA: tetratricopeptide repeat protein [Casimicrobiaceae bacterium]|nr:tetratricopeptide repeat protein [Casimicrobiaceae bacterium]